MYEMQNMIINLRTGYYSWACIDRKEWNCYITCCKTYSYPTKILH